MIPEKPFIGYRPFKMAEFTAVFVVVEGGYMDIKEENGSVDIKEENGSVDIKEENGYVDIKEEDGSVDIKEKNGSVDIKEEDGSVETVDIKEECVGEEEDPLALTSQSTQGKRSK